MSDCTRNYFLRNNKLQPVAEFDAIYHPPLQYIYEVFRVAEGIPLFIEDHLDRLWHTTRLAGVDLGIEQHALLSKIMEVIHSNPEGEGNIKIVYYQIPQNIPRLFIYFTPHQYPTAEQFTHGVRVNIFQAERNMPTAKIMDTRLRKATDDVKSSRKVYEVLLVDQQGFITEGSRSNVFFIKGQTLITPPAGMVLAGITRRQIIHLCKENGIEVIERNVHLDETGLMDALFISGTSRRVLPVCRIDNTDFSVDHPLIGKLADLFNLSVENYIKIRKQATGKPN